MTTRTTDAQSDIQRQLAGVYTPGSPITKPELFSGRHALLDELRAGLLSLGRNFVLFGERGVGKTSFYNVRLYDFHVGRHNCSQRDDFATIFLNILSRLGEQFTPGDRQLLNKFGYEVGGDNMLFSLRTTQEAKTTDVPVVQQHLDLNFVVNKLNRLQTRLEVIVLDEFQNISRPEVQTDIIEVAKALSDNNIQIKLVVVGIGQRVEDLVTSPQLEASNTELVRSVHQALKEIHASRTATRPPASPSITRRRS
jgi:hypothetical protein